VCPLSFHACISARSVTDATCEAKDAPFNPEADYLHSINVFLGLIEGQLPPAPRPGTVSDDAAMPFPYFPDYKSLHAVKVNLGRLEDVDSRKVRSMHTNPPKQCDPHAMPSSGSLPEPQHCQIESCLTALFSNGQMNIVPSDIQQGNNLLDGQTLIKGLDVLVQGNCDRLDNCHSNVHLSLRVLNDARSRRFPDEHYTLCLLETDDNDDILDRQIKPLVDEIHFLDGKLFNDLRSEASYKLRMFISGDWKFLEIAKRCQSDRDRA
jgi:hypothetical protein